LEREWLVTNGIGGYASASLSGANTRRYHGLLVAALQPPLGRTVLLGKLDEEVHLNGQNISLSVNEWRGEAASLDGLAYLEQFELQGNLPSFQYRLNPEATLNKTIWMEYGLNTTYIRYTYHAPKESGSIELKVRPLANYRDYHSDTHGAEDWHFLIDQINEGERPEGGGWQIAAWEGATPWYLLALDNKVSWQSDEGRGWYWGFHYRQEQARGLPAGEDMYCLGTFVTTLGPGQSVTFVATTASPQVSRELYSGSYERELSRELALLKQAKTAASDMANPPSNEKDLLARLTLAADQFIAGRPDPTQPGQLQPEYRTVLAGYPWFGDWGRDTMISLSGLTLATGRYREAALILRSFAGFISKGMLPNRFPDNPQAGQSLPESEYNTVDATLWYFQAIDQYLSQTGDQVLAQELYPMLTEIVRWHVAGTRFNIKVDEQDGLLASGAEGVQLTWMDAKVGDWVVTPRRGKPIEINALWYRACRTMQKLAGQFGTPDEQAYYNGLAEKVANNFEQTYWYEAGGYFYDLINEFGQPDPALRPNQVIALALVPELISSDKRTAALERVNEKLLTPFGLRTLSPDDPAYRPTYGGYPVSRDSAYHQGTIWPWPLGPYLKLLAQSETEIEKRSAINQIKAGLAQHLEEGCVGQVSEIFGAEPPFPPVGCFAQAWSVAQLLEALRGLEVAGQGKE
jgi:predicted glycogen debranching enzyme